MSSLWVFGGNRGVVRTITRETLLGNLTGSAAETGEKGMESSLNDLIGNMVNGFVIIIIKKCCR